MSNFWPVSLVAASAFIAGWWWGRIYELGRIEKGRNDAS